MKIMGAFYGEVQEGLREKMCTLFLGKSTINKQKKSEALLKFEKATEKSSLAQKLILSIEHAVGKIIKDNKISTGANYQVYGNKIKVKSDEYNTAGDDSIKKTAHEMGHLALMVQKFKSQLISNAANSEEKKALSSMPSKQIQEKYKNLTGNQRENVYDNWVKSFSSDEKFADAYLAEEKAVEQVALQIINEMNGVDKNFTKENAKEDVKTWLKRPLTDKEGNLLEEITITARGVTKTIKSEHGFTMEDKYREKAKLLYQTIKNEDKKQNGK